MSVEYIFSIAGVFTVAQIINTFIYQIIYHPYPILPHSFMRSGYSTDQVPVPAAALAASAVA